MKKIDAVVSAKKIRGQGMTEYIIIVALIAIAAIGVFTAFGGTIRSQVAGMANELAGNDAAAEVQLANDHATEAVDNHTATKNLGNYNNNQQNIQ